MTKRQFDTLMKLMLLIAFALPAAAGVAAAEGGLEVAGAWARASIGAAKTGAVYLDLANRGAAADRLLGAETPVAGKASLHTTIEDAGVMKMRPLEAVELPSGGVALLEPGGPHIMLMGLKAPLEEGESFPLTLIFEQAGPREVEVTVKGATAQSGD